MIDIQKTARVIEALIFASPAPVPRRALLPYLENEDQITEVLASIAARYDERSGIELSDIEGHYAFRTRADVAAFLTLERPIQRPLSRAALEVLAIIAYHQPITRSEIEEIRGISLSRGTVDILLELGWITPRGGRRVPGRGGWEKERPGGISGGRRGGDARRSHGDDSQRRPRPCSPQQDHYLQTCCPAHTFLSSHAAVSYTHLTLPTTPYV